MSLADLAINWTEQGLVPILITTADVRLAFKRFFEPSLARLIVLSYQEVPPQTEVKGFSIILPPPTPAQRPLDKAA